MTTREQDTQLSDVLLETLQSALRRHANQRPHSGTARAWLLRDALGSTPVLEALLQLTDSQRDAGALSEQQWRELHELLRELLDDASINTEPGGLATAAFSPAASVAASAPRTGTAEVAPELARKLAAKGQGLATDPIIERSAREREPAAEPDTGPGPGPGPEPRHEPDVEREARPARASALPEVAAKLNRSGNGAAQSSGSGAAQRVVARPVGEPAMPTQVGGRYQLVKEVHRGARSSIWQATVIDDAGRSPPGRSRTYVAVRLTPAELQPAGAGLDADADAAADFEHLSRVSAHPALLTLLTQGREGDWTYQVQAWIEGETLEARLRSNVASLDAGLELPAWIRQLAGALETLHAADFVHGDVKPANVIIRPDGRACLVDLEVVRIGSVTGERRALTPAFASPEALAGAPADPRDDVYSLAVLAFRVLSGYLPYGRSGSLSDGHPLPPPIRPEGLDDTQWRALRQALEPVRELRISSPMALANALWPDASAASAPWARGPRSSARSRRPARSHRGYRFAIGTAAMAAVAVGLAAVVQPDGVAVPSWMPDFPALMRSADQPAATRIAGDTRGGQQDPGVAPQDRGQAAAGDTAEFAQDRLAPMPGGSPDPVVERNDATVAEAPEATVPPEDAPMREQTQQTQQAAATPGPAEDGTAETTADPAAETDAANAPAETAPSPAPAAAPPAAVAPPAAARQSYSFPSSRIQFDGLAPAALIPVRRQGSLERRAEIRFAIDPGSARPDEDFMPPPNNIAVFEPGQAETLIIVPLIRSIEQRTTRSFWIQLRTPGNLTGDYSEIQVVLPPID